jgi:hypothetical protein
MDPSGVWVTEEEDLGGRERLLLLVVVVIDGPRVEVADLGEDGDESRGGRVLMIGVLFEGEGVGRDEESLTRSGVG